MSTASNANTKGQGYVAAGTAIGSVLGSYFGPAGTWLGGSLGATLGGAIGSLDIGGSAKRSQKKARKVIQERENNAQQAAYLQLIRQARMARSGSLAAVSAYGLGSSSLATSALSSIGAQSQYSIQYTANDERLVRLYNKYIKKAGDYAKAAQTTLATGQLVGTAMGVGGAFAGASTAGSAAGEVAKSKAAEQGLTAEMTNTMVSKATLTAYQEALKTGLETTLMFNQITSPILSSVSQFNQGQ